MKTSIQYLRMKAHSLLLVAFLAALVVCPVENLYAAGKEGVKDGGGGGVVYIANQPHLTDFYTIQNSADLLNQKYLNQASSWVESPRLLSFDSKAQVDDVAYATVLAIFSKWSNLPYDSIGMWINNSIYRPVVWNFTDQNILAPQFYRSPFLPPEINIITAAYYNKTDRSFQVNISRKIWNQMQLKDQVGLLIHETLRHVQIGLSFGFDDEALQKATAMMMTCRPRVKYDQYLFYLLNNRRDLAEQRFEAFDLLTEGCWK
jgi:hypothetical protein